MEEPIRAYLVGPPGSATAPPSIPEPFGTPLPEKPSLAVLPFANLSGDPEQDYFADGITEEIITALCQGSLVLRDRRKLQFPVQGTRG